MDPTAANPESFQSALSERNRSRLITQIISGLLDSAQAKERKADPNVLKLLIQAMRSGDSQIMALLSEEIRKLRISPSVLVDIYLPEAAASVGAVWHDEQIDILTATITFARMQSLLRTTASNWHADDLMGTRGTILMISPENDQHTLGALVATSQFRRLGISVTVCLSISEGRALAEVMRQRYDAVCISIGNKSSLASVEKLVKGLRRLANRCPPVFVGGSLPMDLAAVADLTGADLGTRDVSEAVRFLKLEALMINN